MAKKIKHSDLFEGDIFQPTADGARKLLKLTQDLRKGLIDTAKDIKKGFAGIKIESNDDLRKMVDLTDKAKKAQKAKNDIDKEAEKLTKQIKERDDEVVKAKLRFNKATKEQRDRLKAVIVEESKEAGTLEKLSARNKLLRQEREKLNLTTKQGQDRLKAINAELDKNNKIILDNSDKLKQQKINVGNYTEGIKSALKESTLFGRATTFITDSFNKFKGVFSGIINQSKEYINQFRQQRKETLDSARGQGFFAQGLARTKVALQGAATAARIFGAALKATGIGLIVAALGALTVAFTKTQKGADDVSVVMKGLKFAFEAVIGRVAELGFGVFNIFKGIGVSILAAVKNVKLFGLEISRALTFDPKKLQALDKDIAEVNEQLAVLSKDDSIAKGWDQIKESISGVSDEVSEAFERGTALGKVILQFREQNLALREELITTGTQLALANQRAADITLSFQRRLEATEEASALQIKVSEARVQIAKNNAAIARAELEEAQKSGLKDVELREKLLEALEAQDTAETEFALARQERDRQRRDILLKGLTNEVTITEKQFDKITQLFEKQLSDTEKTIRERQKLLGDLEIQSEKLFEDEIKAIEKATGVRIDANELVGESDAKVLFEKIRALGLAQEAETSLNKAVAGRQKQLIQETTAREKLNKETEANVEAIMRLEAEISQLAVEGRLDEINRALEKQKEIFSDPALLTNIKQTAEEIVKLTNAQFDLQEKLLRDRASEEIRVANESITEEDRRAKEIEKINAKLNNDLAKLNDERAKATEAVNEKTLAAIAKQNQEAAQFIIDVLDEAFEKSNERRRKAIDEEIKLREESVKRQEELAAKGLNNTLAFEKKKQAEAELARKEQEKREVRRQKVISYFRAFSEFLKDDPNTAATKALAQVLLADVISGAFAEGVEGLKGKGTATSDSNLALLSKGESVVTAKGTRDNKGLATAMNEGKVDEYFTKNYMPKYLSQGSFLTKSSGANMADSAMLHQLVNVNKRLKGLEQAIQEKPVSNTELTNLGNVITTDIERGFKKITTYKRRKPKL